MIRPGTRRTRRNKWSGHTGALLPSAAALVVTPAAATRTRKVGGSLRRPREQVLQLLWKFHQTTLVEILYPSIIIPSLCQPWSIPQGATPSQPPSSPPRVDRSLTWCAIIDLSLRQSSKRSNMFQSKWFFSSVLLLKNLLCLTQVFPSELYPKSWPCSP